MNRLTFVCKRVFSQFIYKHRDIAWYRTNTTERSDSNSGTSGKMGEQHVRMTGVALANDSFGFGVPYFLVADYVQNELIDLCV